MTRNIRMIRMIRKNRKISKIIKKGIPFGMPFLIIKTDYLMNLCPLMM